VNKGVGGETAEQMFARFPRDVLPYRPQLVIWQSGTNQALASEDVQGYECAVREGIARLKAAHMDVILMDPQYAPRVLARPLHKAILDTPMNRDLQPCMPLPKLTEEPERKKKGLPDDSPISLFSTR